MEFSRDSSVAVLRDASDVWDVLVIGGGASGLSAALEAASRGYRTALVERDDFAKGTSSRSTKIIHGGVRYLKQGNISLVKGALHERGLLMRNAPHLVKRLPFIIPAEKRIDKPFYGLGMKLYDALAGELGLGASSCLDLMGFREALPGVDRRQLYGGIRYYDAQFDDTRLALALARTASNEGAVVANYIEAVSFIKKGSTIAGVRVRDREGGTEFDLHASCVINATGAFSDALRKLDDASASDLIVPSQGAHIVLPRKFYPSESAMMVPKTEDGRVLFAIPWHGVVLVGTTDTKVEDVAEEPRPLEYEIGFLLQHIGEYLANPPLRSDILSAFAGLRPLVGKAGGKTSAISRDHSIEVSASGLITLCGGKWTTCRKMGEDVIARMEEVCGFDSRPSRTAEMKLHGYCEKESTDSLSVYGADADEIRKLVDEDSTLGKPVHPKLPYLRAEFIWAVRSEMARTPEDALARRTRALFINAYAAMEASDVVAAMMASELNRNGVWAREASDAFRKVAQGYLI